MTTNPAQLPTGTPVTIYGQPGRVITVDEDSVLVALDDEGGRRDWWHVSQVEAVQS